MPLRRYERDFSCENERSEDETSEEEASTTAVFTDITHNPAMGVEAFKTEGEQKPGEDPETPGTGKQKHARFKTVKIKKNNYDGHRFR
jgi:hypothetical protein